MTTTYRRLYNNVSGSLGASLSSGGTTITFAVVPPFATLSASYDYIPLVLSPGTANFEIVHLTAYTSGATTGTIVRGAEDATLWPATTHANGDGWECGMMAGQPKPTQINEAARGYVATNAATTASGAYIDIDLSADSFLQGGTDVNYDILVTVPGLYLVTGMFKVTNAGSTNIRCALTKNAVLVTQGSQSPTTATGYQSTVVTDLIPCFDASYSSNDVLSLVYVESGYAAPMQADGPGESCYLSALLVGT